MSAAIILQIGLLVWLLAFAFFLAGRILTGDIDTGGMLMSGRTPAIDPERVIAMAVFPTVVVYYVMHTLGTDVVIVNGRGAMPDIPQELIALLTSGNGIYLAGKIARTRGG